MKQSRILHLAMAHLERTGAVVPLDLADAEDMLNEILQDQEDLIDQAEEFGFRSAATLDLNKAEAILEGILQDQEDLIDQATDFGFRAAARQLMPLAEAKAIVEGFDKNTEKLRSFINSLDRASWEKGVPPEFKADYDKLVDKASKALKKFEVDLEKAKKAMAAHEDRLVGENFQKVYEAVRLRVVDLDPQYKVTFTTDLKLDAEPAYAFGTIRLFCADGKHVYSVIVGYKAEGDKYYGNIWMAEGNHTYKSVVSKIGPTRVPRFAKDLVDQLQALVNKFGPALFGTRAQPPALRIQSPEERSQNLRGPIQEALKKNRYLWHPEKHWYVTSTDRGFELVLKPVGSNTQAVTGLVFSSHWSSKKNEIERLGSFKVKGAVDKATYEVTVKLKSLEAQAGYRMTNITSSSDYQDWLLKNLPEWAYPLPPTPVLKKRAADLGVDIKRLRTSKTIAERIQPTTKDSLPRGIYVGGRADLTVKRITKASGVRPKVAGGCGFDRVVWISDPDKAYRVGSQEAEAEYGHQEGYGGDLQSKNGYRIKNRNPVSLDQAYRDAERDSDRNDKWGPAFARALTNPKVVEKKQMTVTVKARNERDALRRGVLLIEATGRILPGTEPSVEKPTAKVLGGGKRVKEWEVSGLRKLIKAGKVDGWLFYGTAPC